MFPGEFCARLPIALTLLIIAQVARPQTVADDRERTPFQFGAHREPIVKVRVNGEGPYDFVLDTGSSHSAVAKRLAGAIGGPAVATAAVTSSVGTGTCVVVALAGVEVGPETAADVLASVVNDDLIDGSGRIQGIIGQDVLAARRYTIDFGNRRITWHKRPIAPQTALTFPLRLVRERFQIELPQSGSTLSLVPDSGAEGLVLYARRDRRLPQLTALPGRMWLSTITERRSVRRVSVDELRVGAAALRDVPGVLVDPYDGDPSAGDGLLPLALFARVTFDGPARTIGFEMRSAGVP